MFPGEYAAENNNNKGDTAMNKHRRAEKEFLLDKELLRPELETKASRRSLQIRRALEDREENKRLSAICGEDYWEGI